MYRHAGYQHALLLNSPCRQAILDYLVGNQDQVSVLETRSVPTLRIDTLVRSLRPPTVIKIDVEGAEMDVLNGAEQTIATYRPVILTEGPSELWEPMAAFFNRHRYKMLDGAAEGRFVLEHPAWDTVAVPDEKLAAA